MGISKCRQRFNLCCLCGKSKGECIMIDLGFAFNNGSTVVEYAPHRATVESSSPATAAVTGREKMANKNVD
jgi:hypothetical protein